MSLDKAIARVEKRIKELDQAELSIRMESPDWPFSWGSTEIIKEETKIYKEILGELTDETLGN